MASFGFMAEGLLQPVVSLVLQVEVEREAVSNT